MLRNKYLKWGLRFERRQNSQVVTEAAGVDEIILGEHFLGSEKRIEDKALNNNSQHWVEKEKLPQGERTVQVPGLSTLPEADAYPLSLLPLWSLSPILDCQSS